MSSFYTVFIVNFEHILHLFPVFLVSIGQCFLGGHEPVRGRRNIRKQCLEEVQTKPLFKTTLYFRSFFKKRKINDDLMIEIRIARGLDLV